MATKTTRLVNARSRLSLAQQGCPHWDQESGPNRENMHDCCWQLVEAEAELKRALRAARTRS